MDETGSHFEQYSAMNEIDPGALESMGPSLREKRQDILHRLARIKKDHDLSSRVEALAPAIEACLMQMRTWYQAACRKKQEDLLSQAQQESLGVCTSLAPLDNAPGSWRESRKGAWTVLGSAGVGSVAASAASVWAVGLPGAFVALTAWASIGALYRRYLKKAQNIHVRSATEEPLQHLDTIARYDMAMMQFAPALDAAQQDFTDNYNCTFVAVDNRQNIMQTWRLDAKKHGHLHGSTFVALRDISDQGQVALLVKINTSATRSDLEWIELRPGMLDRLLPIKEPLQHYLLEKAPAFIAAITPLTQAIAQYDADTRQEQDILDELETLDAQARLVHPGRT